MLKYRKGGMMETQSGTAPETIEARAGNDMIVGGRSRTAKETFIAFREHE
jgi:hypothetical protein